MRIRTGARRVAAASGLTRGVFYALLSRGWSLLAGPISLFLVFRYLSAEEQGFYYTFWSILALQILFELGFSVVIVQFASHERIGVVWVDQTRQLEGEAGSLDRLASLLRVASRWYVLAGVLLLIVLLPGGIIFFGRYGPRSRTSTGIFHGSSSA